MNNNNNSTKNPKEDSHRDDQRLRLDLWDIPGSTSSSGITHQVCHSSILLFMLLFSHLMQIFLSSRAIYLLVFDLTKDLHQPSEWNKVRRNTSLLRHDIDSFLIVGDYQSGTFGFPHQFSLLLCS